MIFDVCCIDFIFLGDTDYNWWHGNQNQCRNIAVAGTEIYYSAVVGGVPMVCVCPQRGMTSELHVAKYVSGNFAYYVIECLRFCALMDQ